MLLLAGAEKLQRLRHADGLMGAEQGTDRRVGGIGALKAAVVVDLAEAKASVLLGDAHAERTEVGQPFDHAGGNPGPALHLQRVDRRAEETWEPPQKRLPPIAVRRPPPGEREEQNQGEPRP